MYYPREAREAWLKASRQFPVVLLTGPRQVGKTTLLQNVREKRREYVTLDDPVVRALAKTEPALFLQRFGTPLLIDEVQYAPELLPHIKMAVDRGAKPGTFWLTGSQQFLMMKGVSETLAGRVAILNLLGFSRRERYRKALDVPPFLPTPQRLARREGSATPTTLKRVYKDIWTGSMPAMIAGPVKDRDLFYSSYLQTYLQRDVKDLAQIGDEASFLRFLRAAAARTGQLLNMSDLARDAEISVNTAKRWLSILAGSLQVVLLRPFHTNVTKRLVKAPKLYFLDTGLCAYLTEWTTPRTLEAGAMAGPILETFVVGEILKSFWHRGRQPRVYFYRDRDGREIDLLILQNNTLYPIEIKKTASPRAEAAKAFEVLDQFPHRRGQGSVVCMVSEHLPLTGKVSAIPVGLL